MIASRRAARPTGPSTYAPSESGPRWTSVALIAASRPGSTVPRADAIPQIPHMRHYSRSTGGQLRGTRKLQLLMLLVSAAALLLLADPLRIPYPILLVVGGLALGFAPGVPTVTLPPDAVIFGILPPLLYSAAFNTGLRDLKRNLRPISLLAIGLVAPTMVSVAVAAHSVIGLSWPVALCSAQSSRLRTRSPRPRSPAVSEFRGGQSRSSRGKPPQRRHGARPLQVRRRCGRHGDVLVRGSGG